MAKKTTAKKSSKAKKQYTPKKQNKRSRVKYAALNPAYNLKTRTDLIDYDYIDKLSEREKAWLNKFTQEYVNAGKLNKKDRPLHKTQELRKDCYDRNNARNRCQYTRQKASIGNKYLEEHKNELYEDPTEDMDLMVDINSPGYYEDYTKLREIIETNEKSNKQVRKQKKQS